MQKFTLQYGKTCQVILVALAVSACSGRKVENELPPEDTAKDKRIESLTSALSRAQSRIEEMDARLAAISDKVDATRLTVDNLTGGGLGSKALKTEPVGAAREHSAKSPGLDDEQLSNDDENPSEERKAKQAEGRILLRMDTALTDFIKAMRLFKAGKYTEAELSFNHFTEQYPEHVMAGSAQFYSGESYYMMNEFKLAINEYGKVISTFSSSPRVASAMVRLSQCYEQTGNSGEAARTLTLAHELYKGNPSLDWVASGARKIKNMDLNAAPLDFGEVEHAKPKTEGQHDSH